MSISDMAVSMATAWTPSTHACRAQKGSPLAARAQQKHSEQDGAVITS